MLGHHIQQDDDDGDDAAADDDSGLLRACNIQDEQKVNTQQQSRNSFMLYVRASGRLSELFFSS